MRTGTTLDLSPKGQWKISSPTGVSLVPFAPCHLKAVTAAASDPVAKQMLHHRIDLTGNAEKRRAAVLKLVNNQWNNTQPYAVVITPQLQNKLRRRGNNSHRSAVIGLRWLEDGKDGIWSCGGWLHSNWRGLGLGKVALTLMLEWVARGLDGEAVATGALVENVASQANLRSAGFVPDPEPLAHHDFETGKVDEKMTSWWHDLNGFQRTPIPTVMISPKRWMGNAALCYPTCNCETS